MEESRALVDRVLQQDPDNSSAQATKGFLDSAAEAEAEKKLRSAVQADPSSASATDRLARFLWKRGKDLEARRLASIAVSLDASNVSYRINLANIMLSQGDEEAAIETLRTAATLAKTLEETAAVDRQLKEAMAYASSLKAGNNEAREKTTSPASETADSAQSHHNHFVPAGSHRFVVGVLKGVRCDPPTLDLTVTSPSRTVASFRQLLPSSIHCLVCSDWRSAALP